MALLTTLALTSALGTGGGFELQINEIRIDQPGADNDEYFELRGTSSINLDDIQYLVIGDGTGGSGTIESVTDLTGLSIGPSGYFVAAESTFSLGTADLTTTLSFENSDNVTHMLVEGFTGALGDDLDLNDDGLLDVFPFKGVFDAINLVETPYAGERNYAENFEGDSIGPDGTFVPGHAFRCTHGWQIGNFVPGATDTPGEDNSPLCPGPRINEIRIDQPGGDDDEYFELRSEQGTRFDDLSYIVIGDGSGGSGVVESVTDLDGLSAGSTGFFVAAEGSFSLGTADLTTSLGFENSDNVTHLLVKDFTGILQEDLDTDDDGVLDITPWSEVVDAVSLVIEVGGGDQYYGSAVGFADLGPNGSFAPAHAVRCGEGWRIGFFAIDKVTDTPSGPNDQCGIVVDRCEATAEDPINQGLLAIDGSGSLQLNDSSVVVYALPVDSFGVMIAGLPDRPESTIFGLSCINGSATRVAYGFASGGQFTFPIDLVDPIYGTLGTGASGFAYLDSLAFQYLYRDASAPSGARFSEAIVYDISL